jgi:hypothetical protein
MMRTFEPSSTAVGRVAMQSPGHGRAPETAPVHQAMAISTSSYWHLFPPNNGIHPWDSINTKHKLYLTQNKKNRRWHSFTGEATDSTRGVQQHLGTEIG